MIVKMRMIVILLRAGEGKLKSPNPGDETGEERTTPPTYYVAPCLRTSSGFRSFSFLLGLRGSLSKPFKITSGPLTDQLGGSRPETTVRGS